MGKEQGQGCTKDAAHCGGPAWLDEWARARLGAASAVQPALQTHSHTTIIACITTPSASADTRAAA